VITVVNLTVIRPRKARKTASSLEIRTSQDGDRCAGGEFALPAMNGDFFHSRTSVSLLFPHHESFNT
jgi:hypothetical protein